MRKGRRRHLRRLEQTLMDRAYIEAYSRVPESPGWGSFGALMLAEGLEGEKPW